MANNSDDDISQIIALIRKIEAAAYKRGLDETVTRIVAAAHGKMEATATTLHQPANGVDQPAKPRETGKRAARGSIGRFVYRVLSAPDYQGANYEGIIDRVRGLGGTDIAPASVRNHLRTLERNKEARRQNDLWFLSQPPWAREGESRADPQPGESQPL
jgi:hypothetical protein